VDDETGQLAGLLDELTRHGAQAVTVSYLFLTIWAKLRLGAKAPPRLSRRDAPAVQKS
jgi:hypothetical protein